VISRAIVLTVVFTIVALAFSFLRLGPLVVAMLGGFVVWWIPAHLVVALPAAAFGGILLAQTEPVDTNEQGEDRWSESLRLIVLTTLVSLLTVGWFVPWRTRRRVRRSLDTWIAGLRNQRPRRPSSRSTSSSFMRGARPGRDRN
jgi:hypothetical protein